MGLFTGDGSAGMIAHGADQNWRIDVTKVYLNPTTARSLRVCVNTTEPDANSPPYIDNTSYSFEPIMFDGYHLLLILLKRLATNRSDVSGDVVAHFR